jgi:hypothetical protein
MERFAETLSWEVEKYTADHYKDLLREGIRQGRVRADLDVNQAAFLINSLYIMTLVSLIIPHFRIRMREYLEIREKLTKKRIRQEVDRVIRFLQEYLSPGIDTKKDYDG